MAKPVHVDHVEPDLVAGWVAARSIARGLPAPVLDHGGLRVDTGLPGETRRYVFAGPAHGIRALAESIDEPHIPIKICGTGDQLLALVPRRWELQQAAYFMTRDGAGEAAPIPASGYRLEFSIENQATAAHRRRRWQRRGQRICCGTRRRLHLRPRLDRCRAPAPWPGQGADGGAGRDPTRRRIAAAAGGD